MTQLDPEQHRLRIQQAVTQWKWGEAAALLAQWTERFPKQPKSWFLRAQCVARTGDLKTALACARRAHAMAPSEAVYLELVTRIEERLEPAAPGEPMPTMVDPSPEVEPTVVEDVSATLCEPQPDGVVDRPPTSPRPPGESWAEGMVVEGRYQVRGSTRGGMGEVVFVHDRELGLDIAVKTPLPSAMGTEAGRQRFLREAEAWVALGLHPNICTAYYAREIGGLPRLFIEYVDGGNLAEWLGRNPDLTAADRLDLAIQIAEGMEHAHTFGWNDEEGHEHSGLVHRDLKPANVLVGSDGRARVTDFGLVGRDIDGGPSTDQTPQTPGTGASVTAAVADQNTGSIWGTMTMAGGILGSPMYMAPEHWDGAHFAGRPADIYAFGCILYELMCDRHPFEIDPRYMGADAQVKRTIWEQMHRSESPADPRSLVPGLDDGLADVLLSCLAKEAAQRPPSFANLGEHLRGAFSRIAGREYPRPTATGVALAADSLNNRGVSFASLGQPQRAERAWRDALAADPRHLHAGFNLALFEWQLRGATDREVINRMAELRRAGNRSWRHDLLAGRALLLLGEYEEALKCLDHAAGAAGNAPEAARDLGFGLCAAATEDPRPELWQRADSLLFQKGSALRTDPAMLVCYSLAARRLGEDEKSLRLWAEARRQLEDPPPTLELGAARLLPGSQLVRRTDARLGRIGSVTVDPTGGVAVFGTDTGALAVIDPTSGAIRTLRGHGGRIRCTAVAAAAGLVLSWEENEAVTVWSLDTGGRRSIQSHTGHLSTLTASTDGRLAAGGGSAGSLIVWDLTTGRRRTVIDTHSGFITCVALAGDASSAVTGGNDGSLVVVDLTHERPIAKLAANTDGVASVALSSDGRFLLSGGSDGVCTMWDVERQKRVADLKGHGGSVDFVAFSADVTRAITGAADGTLRMWELDSGRAINSERVPGPVVTGSASNDLGFVAVAHGPAISAYTMREPPSYRPPWAVSHLVTSSEAEERTRLFNDLLERSNRLIESGDIATARLELDRARSIPGYERAPETLQAMAEVDSLFPHKALEDGWEEAALRSHGDAVMAVAVSPLGDRAVSCGRDRRLVIWDLEQQKTTGEISLPMIPLAATFVGDRELVATADLDNTLRLWSLDADSTPIQLEGHEGRIHALAGEPTGRWLVTASADGTARVWDAVRGACRHVLEGHLGRVYSCAVSPDGRRAATGGDDGNLLTWDLTTGLETMCFDGHTAAVRHLAWSLEGRFLLSTGDDAIRLWDARTGRCLRTIEAEGGPPTAAALSPDSRFAVVGAAGGAVGLWSLRDRRLHRVFEGHTGAVSAAAFTRDGRRLLTGGADGTVRLWFLAWEAEPRGFVEWDETALPHLEVFLAQHTPPDGGPPSWRDGDVRRLLSDLRHRGLGWIRPDGIRAKLETLSKGIGEGSPATTPSVAARRLRRKATPRSREVRRKRSFRLIVAAGLGIPLLLVGSHLWSLRQLHLDSRAARDLRSHNLTLLVAPMVTTRKAECDRARLEDYLQDYTGPTDSLKDWSAANYCLMVLADPRSVEPVLKLARQPPDRPEPITGIQIGADQRQVMDTVRRAMSGGLDTESTVQSLLARMGRPVVPSLIDHLDDPEVKVREIAAGALALAGTESSIAALVDRVDDPDPLVRRAVSLQIANLAISNRLDIEEAFRVALEMSEDGDPEVRLNTAEKLGIFAGSKPRALARRLAGDVDPDVRNAAEHHIH